MWVDLKEKSLLSCLGVDISTGIWWIWWSCQKRYLVMSKIICCFKNVHLYFISYTSTSTTVLYRCKYIYKSKTLVHQIQPNVCLTRIGQVKLATCMKKPAWLLIHAWCLFVILTLVRDTVYDKSGIKWFDKPQSICVVWKNPSHGDI